jgi:predicted Rossmann fold nucleotide-binding protein DprA/Smf involved in DNA uptake
MEDLPTYSEYKAHVDALVSQGELSLEQGILLCQCFKATLNESPIHINYLMQCANMRWKEINWTLNGLVQRGAIRRIEEKYYMV